VEAEPEACGRGFGAVAGGEVKVAEEVRAGAELGGDCQTGQGGGGGGGVWVNNLDRSGQTAALQ
jgi:hypothetical protein